MTMKEMDEKAKAFLLSLPKGCPRPGSQAWIGWLDEHPELKKAKEERTFPKPVPFFMKCPGATGPGQSPKPPGQTSLDSRRPRAIWPSPA